MTKPVFTLRFLREELADEGWDWALPIVDEALAVERKFNFLKANIENITRLEKGSEVRYLIWRGLNARSYTSLESLIASEATRPEKTT